jgi:hypothetical protein
MSSGQYIQFLSQNLSRKCYYGELNIGGKILFKMRYRVWIKIAHDRNLIFNFHCCEVN